MIDQQGGVFWVACDRCCDTTELDSETFSEAREDLQKIGWLTRPAPKGGFEDVCSCCLETENEAVKAGSW